MDDKKRIETGALQINNDWTGLFVRGDDAFTLQEILLDAQCFGKMETLHANVLCDQLLKTIEQDVRHSGFARQVQRIKTK